MRGDITVDGEPLSSCPFQFTPLREGRQRATPPAPPEGQFQFTPLREGRPAAAVHRSRGDADFNSRPYVRGDLARQEKGGLSRTFQFTPLREGRPDRADGEPERPISIHAPT